MADTLFLRFSETIEGGVDPVEWGVLADLSDAFCVRGKNTSVSDAVDEARAQLDDAGWHPDNVVMVVPASATLITEVNITARRKSQMRRALPFVVEEQLADDIDDVHLALGTLEAQRPVSVVVVDKNLLRSWVARVAGADLIADAAVPDALLAPSSEAHVTIHLEGDDALVRWANGAARVQRDLLPQVVAPVGAGLEEAEDLEITVAYDGEHSLDDLASARLESELSDERSVSVSLERRDSDLFQRLCAHYRTAAPFINLLQGEFLPVRRRGQAPLARFAWAAVLLLVWLSGQLGFVATEALLLQRDAQLLEAQAITLYRQWYPQDQRVTLLNIRDRTLAHIKTGAADAPEDEFFSLLSAIARQLNSSRGADLHRIGYNESTRRLTLEISADSYPTIEGITDALEADGIGVEITTVSPDEERVKAHLRIARS